MFLEGLDLALQYPVASQHILPVFLANPQVIVELLVDLLDLVIFGENEVDLSTGLLQLGFQSIGFIFFLF